MENNLGVQQKGRPGTPWQVHLRNGREGGVGWDDKNFYFSFHMSELLLFLPSTLTTPKIKKN